MPQLARRPWVPEPSETLVQQLAARTQAQAPAALIAQIDALVAENHRLHDQRGINLNPASNVMNPRAEALLFAADKAQHVHELIAPALERGEIVISDRYVLSMIAYHASKGDQ